MRARREFLIVRWITINRISAVARLAVVRAAFGVFLGRNRQIQRLSLDMHLMQLLQERHAPLASSPRAKAIRYLARHARILPSDEVGDLPQRNAKAEADMIVRIHRNRVRGKSAENYGVNL